VELQGFLVGEACLGGFGVLGRGHIACCPVEGGATLGLSFSKNNRLAMVMACR
jgi:hypothetical protein